MEFDVALVPVDVINGKGYVCVLIDVLRASSAISVLFDKGCSEIKLTDNLEEALNNPEVLSLKTKGQLKVCAEDVLGRCRQDADFSPSVELIEGMDNLNGKTVLMQTTNGTAAIHKLYKQGVSHILIGCMLNAKAVMEKAVDLAEALSLDISVVCAGRGNSTLYTIDDSYCAARLVEYGVEAAVKKNIKWTLKDSAKIAGCTLLSYQSAEEALQSSASGCVMRNINCHRDIELCAKDSLLTTVPVVDCNAKPFIVIKNF